MFFTSAAKKRKSLSKYENAIRAMENLDLLAFHKMRFSQKKKFINLGVKMSELKAAGKSWFLSRIWSNPRQSTVRLSIILHNWRKDCYKRQWHKWEGNNFQKIWSFFLFTEYEGSNKKFLPFVLSSSLSFVPFLPKLLFLSRFNPWSSLAAEQFQRKLLKKMLHTKIFKKVFSLSLS